MRARASDRIIIPRCSIGSIQCLKAIDLQLRCGFISQQVRPCFPLAPRFSQHIGAWHLMVAIELCHLAWKAPGAASRPGRQSARANPPPVWQDPRWLRAGLATQQRQLCSLPVTKLRDALEQPVVRLALDAELASDVCSTPKLRAQQAQPVSRFLTSGSKEMALEV